MQCWRKLRLHCIRRLNESAALQILPISSRIPILPRVVEGSIQGWDDRWSPGNTVVGDLAKGGWRCKGGGCLRCLYRTTNEGGG